MDKKEYKIRLEEIMTLIANNQFQDAVKIADKIDWREIKSFGTLEKISNLYKVNRRFDHAFEIAEFAYEYNPVNSNIVYNLCELSIELNNLVQALEFLARYREIAPNNPSGYILEYKIKELGNATLEEKIDILEELKRKDFKQEWVYQLAYLYHRVGLATKCVEVCDELVTMMGDGPFVIKAMELKMLHTPLSKRQQEIYDARNNIQEEIEAVESDEYTAETPEPGAMPELGDEDFHVKTIDMSKFNTINLQKALADSMKELLGEDNNDADKNSNDSNALLSTDRILGADYETEELAEEPEEYSEEEYAEEEYESDEYVEEEYIEDEYLEDEYTEEEYAEEYSEDEYGNAEEEYYEDEVFFDDKTGDIVIDQVPFGMAEDIISSVPSKKKTSEMTEEEAIAFAAAAITRATGNTGKIKVEDITTGTLKDVSKTVKKLETMDISMEEEAYNNAPYEEEPVFESDIKPVSATGRIPEIKVPERKEINKEVNNKRSSKFDEVLSLENDGQISMAMPKKIDNFEKQITGQMNFQEVIAGWEDFKKEREKKQKESINNKILESTGKIFENYDHELKSGILAQLEEEERHNKRLIKNDLELHKVDDFKLDNNIFDEEDKNQSPSIIEKGIEAGEALAGGAVAAAAVAAGGAVAGVMAAEEAATEKVVEDVKAVADIAGAVVSDAINAADNTAEKTETNIKEEAVNEDNIDDVAKENEETSETVEVTEKETEENEAVSEDASVSEEILDSEISDSENEDVDTSDSDKDEKAVDENVSEEAANEEISDSEETDNEQNSDEEYYDEEYDEEYYDENGEPYDEEYEEYYDENGEPYDEEYEEYYDENGEPYYEDGEFEDDNIESDGLSLNTAQINDIGSVLEADADKVTKDVESEINDEYNPSEDRSFSLEEQELFADFMYSKKMRNQILEAVDLIGLAAYVGNVIITGDDSDTAIELAKSLIKEVQLMDANFISQKVAKISGNKMNSKDINGLFAQLSNGALIIEKAGEMKKETLENVTKALENTQDGILILLLDTKRAVDKMVRKYAMLDGYFNVRVDIAPMNENALVEYAKKYAYSKEYKIDEERAVLALHTRIGELQIGDHHVTKQEIEEIVDRAIEKSSKFRISTVFKIVAGKRYDYEDMIVLSEKDFS